MGSYAIWDVQFSSARRDRVFAKKIVDIPEAGFLDGMTVLNKNSGTLLIGDSRNGVVYSLNPDTGDYEVVLEDETMKPPAGQNLGLNGIRTVIVGDATFLYYANSLRETIGRVQNQFSVWSDDFTYDRGTGDIYVAGNFKDIVTKLDRQGSIEGIIGAKN
ncbi:hypothetical protein ZTR_03802 [Talaromyces verruculosus]|nr:hypothetical protein ZTR_03802 [Talaromyces verruculosus]